MVIHNASFDMKFLNAELDWMGLPQLPMDQALDTLAIARRKFPGSPASLDALCRRFGISNEARVLHGALLDSEILAEVYLELIGGRQPDLVLSNSAGSSTEVSPEDWRPMRRETPLPPRLSDSEKAAHAAFVEEHLGADALWSKT
jgi:DNA polymerase-3 subunit epsilon